MKWITLWIKNFADYFYTKLPSLCYHKSYFAQKQKISGSQAMEILILKCLCPHVGCVAP